MSVSCVNCTSVSEFILGGLTETPHLEKVLCSIFFLIYAMNVAGNLSIIIIVALDCNLHSPMYFFLGNLSFLDICFSSVAVPRMLHDFITRQKVISLAACLAQMHFFHFLGSTEVLLLTAMSYDRFIAICRPLHYTEIMNRKLCLTLAIGSWATGFLHSLLHTISTSLLPFCGPNIVNHFFCDIKPLLKLSCTNTSFNSSLLLFVTGSLVMISFLLTLLSYIYIGYTLAWIPSATGRSRGFSTCAAHLIVVILLYGTALFTYLRPVTEKSIEIDRIAAILFTILTPMLNPIIYTLRNQDVQNALVKLANSWI